MNRRSHVAIALLSVAWLASPAYAQDLAVEAHCNRDGTATVILEAPLSERPDVAADARETRVSFARASGAPTTINVEGTCAVMLVSVEPAARGALVRIGLAGSVTLYQSIDLEGGTRVELSYGSLPGAAAVGPGTGAPAAGAAESAPARDATPPVRLEPAPRSAHPVTDRNRPWSSLSLSLDYFTYSMGGDVHAFVPSATGTLQLATAGDWHILLDLDWPLSAVSISAGGRDGMSQLVTGNPSAALRLGTDIDDLRITFGVGFAIPLVELAGEGLLSNTALTLGWGMGALMDPWRWLGARTLPILARLGARYDLDLLQLRADAAGAMFIPFANQNTFGSIQIRLDARVVPIPLLGVGLRAMTVAVLSDSVNGQVALEPYLHGEFQSMFVDLALTMQFAEPVGPSFVDDGVWRLRLELGAMF